MSTIDHELLRELKSSVDGKFAPLRDDLDALEVRLIKVAEAAGLAAGQSDGRAVKGAGPFLTLERKAAPYFHEAQPFDGADDVRLGALVAAIAGGQKVSRHLNDSEQKALVTMTGPAGGYLVPEAVGSRFIDAVRPRTRVLEAGALTYPMEAPIVHLPGWDTLVTAGWRAEGAAFHDAAPTFRAVDLQAKSVATRVTVSVEMLEDAGGNLPGVSTIIENEIANALGAAIDRAALIGSGVDGEPLGLINAGIGSVSMATNGAIPTDYDKLLDTLYAVEAGNFTASAAIYSARTANTLRKLVTGISGDKTKLTAPPEFAALRRLVTNQVPDTLTWGNTTDNSAAFFGDWSQLVIGFRPELGVRVQTDPYTQAGSGLVVINAYMRADVAVLNKTAFSVLSGIRA